jgi:hypothetical protein
MSTLIMGAGAQFCPAQRLWSSMVRYCGVTDYFYLGGGADTPVHYSESAINDAEIKISHSLFRVVDGFVAPDLVSLLWSAPFRLMDKLPLLPAALNDPQRLYLYGLWLGERSIFPL